MRKNSMKKALHMRGFTCTAVIVCLVACMVFVQPSQQREAHANPAIAFGVISTLLGASNATLGGLNRAGGAKTAEELRKIQDQIEKQGKMLEQMQKQLEELQRTVETMAKNLEINTKEIQSYIKSVGAQDAIDSIATRFMQLERYASRDVTKMTPVEIDRLNIETGVWATDVLGAWDIEKAVTKLKSAIVPDVPGTQGVLELWTDMSILKMKDPRSAAVDFSVIVESINGSQDGELLPFISELPQYFDFDGFSGGSLSAGEDEPSTTWYFAEGSCRPGFRPFICISNPTDTNAQVEITYMLGNATVIKESLDVPERFRATVEVKEVLGEGDDASWDFSTFVRSTNDVPVVVEMPQYFNFNGDWEGGFTVSGVTSPGSEWYLAEGTARPNFATFITIQNPEDTDTAARLTYMKGDGTTEEETVLAPAHSRVTVRPSDLLGVGDDDAHDFSTRVESVDGAGLVVARPMYFDYGEAWEGGHCSTATREPSRVCYLAEGTARPNFATFITIQNPEDTDTAARLTYMKGDGTTEEETVLAPAHSRVTVRPSDLLGVGDGDAHDFSTRVESVDGAGLVVERSQYFLYQGLWAGGHCGMAAPESSTKEHFAEGTIRPGFDPYVTIQNPNAVPVNIRLTYMWGDGHSTTENRIIPAETRDTVRVIDSDAAGTLTSYYNSLKSYFETLLYWQQMGMSLICEAYNRKFLNPESDPPAQQVSDYISKTYRKLIQEGLDEFLKCVESLVISWSYAYSPNALPPEAAQIFADADRLFMNINNALLYTGQGDTKTFYGVFGRAFKKTQFDNAQDLFIQGSGIKSEHADQTWRPVRLKYYDKAQQKLICDESSVGVVRYHRNAEPGSYRAGARDKTIIEGGSAPILSKAIDFQVMASQDKNEEGDTNELPFGSFTFTSRPNCGYLGQFGMEGIQEMRTMLKDPQGTAIDASAGLDFCAYIQSGSKQGSGRLKGWGNNTHGQLDFPAGEDYVKLSAGGRHGIALRQDGSVIGWGDNRYGQTNCPPGKDFVHVAAGDRHSIALRKDGTVVGWGDNRSGQVDCPLGNGFVQVTAGLAHNLALKDDGSIVGWGHNGYSQINCPPGNDFIQVSAGDRHSLAIRQDGSVIGWGFGSAVDCPPGNDFIQVAAGGWHSLGLKKDGSVIGWGSNHTGQTSAPAGSGSTFIAAGGDTSLYICDAGLFAWGYNYTGTLNCPPGKDFVQMSASIYTGFALRQDGSVVGWGDNRYGQTNCPPGKDFLQVAASDGHGLALKKDGSVVGWGYNGYGQTSCPPGNDFIQVAAGGYHSLALKKDGSVVGWGDNRKGAASPPAGKDFVQIAAGQDYGIALKKDGSIVGWGRNDFGQTNCPIGNDFVKIAAGGGHGLALRKDGSVIGWGYNREGAASPPAGKDFVQIAAGCRHSLALRKDGSLAGWGYDEHKCATPPAGKNFLQVECGLLWSVVMMRAGLQPWTWR